MLEKRTKREVFCKSVNSVLMAANCFKPVKFHVSNQSILN